MPDGHKHYAIQRPWLALAAGLAVGTLGGLIGLGGAEFRLPILISTFALLPHRAVRFNLLVSLVTLTAAAATRLEFHSSLEVGPFADVLTSMIVGGMIAAWIGAAALSRIPAKRLMSIIVVLLMMIALMLTIEATYATTFSLAVPDNPVARWIAGVAAGLFVGAVSSLLGVAGGEFIIPILVFVFGAGIKTAGTLSLLISLPIVAIGVLKHRLTGHYRSRDVLIRLVLPMSAGSVMGAFLGALLADVVASAALKVILAVILASSAVKLSLKRERQ